jgi:hypothetical protein
MKSRVTIELQTADGTAPVLGNLIDISLGGCFVETSAILQPGKPLKLVFSIDDGKLFAEGSILRIDPGTGVAIQFNDMNRENRERIPRILEYVQNTTTFYDNRYLTELRKTQ